LICGKSALTYESYNMRIDLKQSIFNSLLFLIVFFVGVSQLYLRHEMYDVPNYLIYFRAQSLLKIGMKERQVDRPFPEKTFPRFALSGKGKVHFWVICLSADQLNADEKRISASEKGFNEIEAIREVSEGIIVEFDEKNEVVDYLTVR